MNELDIINLDSSDKTYEDIAREVNLNKEQVRYIFKKNKIKKLKSHSSIEDLSQSAIEDICISKAVLSRWILLSKDPPANLLLTL